MGSKPVQELLKEKKIFEIINPRLVKASPDITVKDAVDLMQEKKSGYIVIAEDDKVIGIFTETDVICKTLEESDSSKKPVIDYMTKNPVTLTPKDSIGEAIKKMGKGRFYHIPLVDEENKLTGVISVRSLIRFLAEFYPTEVYNLPPKPDQIMETPEGG